MNRVSRSVEDGEDLLPQYIYLNVTSTSQPRPQGLSDIQNGGTEKTL